MSNPDKPNSYPCAVDGDGNSVVQQALDDGLLVEKEPTDCWPDGAQVLMYKWDVEKQQKRLAQLEEENAKLQLSPADHIVIVDGKRYNSNDVLKLVRRIKKAERGELERRFPIRDGPSVPWSVMLPHERQAISNHDQDLEKLASRGGLGAGEAWAIVNNKHWTWADKIGAKAKWFAFAEEQNGYGKKADELRDDLLDLKKEVLRLRGEVITHEQERDELRAEVERFKTRLANCVGMGRPRMCETAELRQQLADICLQRDVAESARTSLEAECTILNTKITDVKELLGAKLQESADKYKTICVKLVEETQKNQRLINLEHELRSTLAAERRERLFSSTIEKKT